MNPYRDTIKNHSKIGLLTWLLPFILPLRKNIIFSNLDIVFNGSLGHKEKHYFTAAFYRHILRMLWDIIKFAFFKVRPHVEIQIAPAVLRYLQTGGRLIAVSGHFGNWELAILQGLAKHPVLNHNLSIIRRNKLKPKWLNRIIFRAYQRNNIKVFVAGKRAIEKATKQLKQGGVLVFPYDQHTNTDDKSGLSLPFFGQTAGCYTSLAWLALKTNSLVAVMDISYQGNVIAVEVSDFIEEHPENPERFLTACNQSLEACILKHPIQWWWWHRRWKLSYDYEKQTLRD